MEGSQSLRLKSSFPDRLYQLIEQSSRNPGKAIWWSPDGKSFKIDPRFESVCLSSGLLQGIPNAQKFNWALNQYGFRQLRRSQSAPYPPLKRMRMKLEGHREYFHAKFQQGRADLLSEVRRERVRVSKGDNTEGSKGHEEVTFAHRRVIKGPGGGAKGPPEQNGDIPHADSTEPGQKCPKTPQEVKVYFSCGHQDDEMGLERKRSKTPQELRNYATGLEVQIGDQNGGPERQKWSLDRNQLGKVSVVHSEEMTPVRHLQASSASFNCRKLVLKSILETSPTDEPKYSPGNLSLPGGLYGVGREEDGSLLEESLGFGGPKGSPVEVQGILPELSRSTAKSMGISGLLAARSVDSLPNLPSSFEVDHPGSDSFEPGHTAPNLMHFLSREHQKSQNHLTTNGQPNGLFSEAGSVLEQKIAAGTATMSMPLPSDRGFFSQARMANGIVSGDTKNVWQIEFGQPGMLQQRQHLFGQDRPPARTPPMLNDRVTTSQQNPNLAPAAHAAPIGIGFPLSGGERLANQSGNTPYNIHSILPHLDTTRPVGRHATTQAGGQHSCAAKPYGRLSMPGAGSGVGAQAESAFTTRAMLNPAGTLPGGQNGSTPVMVRCLMPQMATNAGLPPPMQAMAMIGNHLVPGYFMPVFPVRTPAIGPQPTGGAHFNPSPAQPPQNPAPFANGPTGPSVPGQFAGHRGSMLVNGQRAAFASRHSGLSANAERVLGLANIAAGNANNHIGQKY